MIHFIAFPSFSTDKDSTGFYSAPPGSIVFLDNLSGVFGAFSVLALSLEEGILRTIDFKTYYEDFGNYLGNDEDSMDEFFSFVFFKCFLKFMECACNYGAKLLNVTQEFKNS